MVYFLLKDVLAISLGVSKVGVLCTRNKLQLYKFFHSKVTNKTYNYISEESPSVFFTLGIENAWCKAKYWLGISEIAATDLQAVEDLYFSLHQSFLPLVYG